MVVGQWDIHPEDRIARMFLSGSPFFRQLARYREDPVNKITPMFLFQSNPHDHRIVAWQYVKSNGAKVYGYACLTHVAFIRHMSNVFAEYGHKGMRFYEVIPQGLPVRFFVDLDVSDESKIARVDELWTVAGTVLMNFGEHVMDMCGCNDVGWYVADSTRPGKASRHYVMHMYNNGNEVFFPGCYALSTMYQTLLEFCTDKDILWVRSVDAAGNVNKASVFDKSVYTKNRQLRVIYSAKIDGYSVADDYAGMKKPMVVQPARPDTPAFVWGVFEQASGIRCGDAMNFFDRYSVVPCREGTLTSVFGETLPASAGATVRDYVDRAIGHVSPVTPVGGAYVDDNVTAGIPKGVLKNVLDDGNVPSSREMSFGDHAKLFYNLMNIGMSDDEIVAFVTKLPGNTHKWKDNARDRCRALRPSLNMPNVSREQSFINVLTMMFGGKPELYDKYLLLAEDAYQAVYDARDV